jgi:hypothetical protein
MSQPLDEQVYYIKKTICEYQQQLSIYLNYVMDNLQLKHVSTTLMVIPNSKEITIQVQAPEQPQTKPQMQVQAATPTSSSQVLESKNDNMVDTHIVDDVDDCMIIDGAHKLFNFGNDSKISRPLKNGFEYRNRRRTVEWLNQMAKELAEHYNITDATPFTHRLIGGRTTIRGMYHDNILQQFPDVMRILESAKYWKYKGIPGKHQ